MAWTLGQLQTFVTVAELGSMTRAADQLGYSVGAVSQHMSALRRTVGADLVLRRGRGLTLTEAGRTLLPRARHILAAHQQAETAMLGRDFGSEAIVTLGVFGSTSVVALPAIVAILARRHPNIEVRAREVNVETMSAAVIEGAIDLGIGIDYPAVPLPPMRGLRWTTVATEPFGVVTPRGVPLPGPDDLAEADWILPPATDLFGRAMRLATSAMGINAKETHIVTDTAVALALAGTGLGLTLATPIMMALVGHDIDLHPVDGAGGRNIIVLTSPEPPAPVASVAEVVAEVLA
ncbi:MULTISPECIES: LysR family transcriptional regulator [Brevibacterium]|uniref:LysR family transcriptional regulator n=1 Tax=Brevibacterium TaxID=1696 RepID=UPI0014307079|nr:LysR family transcriptional regulator [Brevibacterium casei]MCT2358812.1 LysR family transcriptional regulator [Brevibacterium casei]NJE65636.1 LysR family transcriptional regulator [Brevibacterium sp. LS14]QZE26472.1 LysR family transcriptional regulator [Brevibacterium casei]